MTARFVRRTELGSLLPPPTAEDRIEGERVVAEDFDADPTLCPVWLANNREELVDRFASIAMQKRMRSTGSRAVHEIRSAA